MLDVKCQMLDGDRTIQDSGWRFMIRCSKIEGVRSVMTYEARRADIVITFSATGGKETHQHKASPGGARLGWRN
jgi:hypothetical protein